MPAVDTNIVVRFIVRDDETQAQRSKAILLDRGVWIAKTVLLETEWVLRSTYKYSRQAMHDALTDLLGLPGVEAEDSAEVAQALKWFAAGLDFADALHLASRPDGARFVTFDEALARQARRAGIASVASVAP